MPIPVSVTSMCSIAGVDRVAASMRVAMVTPPSEVNFRALPTMLVTICRSRVGSHGIVAGIGESETYVSPIAFSSAFTPSTATTSLMIACTSQSVRSTSSRPASTLDRSRMSLIRSSRWRPDEWIVSRCFCFS